MKKKYLIFIIVFFILLISGFIYYKLDFNKKNHYVDVENIINKMCTTTEGYTPDIEEYVSKDVFNKSNIYKSFKGPSFKQPIKIGIILNEINQKKINEKIFVYLKYDLDVYDGDGTIVSGEHKVPVVFTVTDENNNIYIEDRQDFETDTEVPKKYK